MAVHWFMPARQCVGQLRQTLRQSVQAPKLLAKQRVRRVNRLLRQNVQEPVKPSSAATGTQDAARQKVATPL